MGAGLGRFGLLYILKGLQTRGSALPWAVEGNENRRERCVLQKKRVVGVRLLLVRAPSHKVGAGQPRQLAEEWSTIEALRPRTVRWVLTLLHLTRV